VEENAEMTDTASELQKFRDQLSGRVLSETESLFADRKIPEMLVLAGLPHANALMIYNRLTSVQNAIYPLDKYGEIVWRVSSVDLFRIWNEIHHQLSSFGLDKADRDHI
jgi:hypothetical protein